MSKIVILGAGVMGSALAVPAAAHMTNNVTLVGSPLDNDIVDAVQLDRHHPTLNASLSDSITIQHNEDLSDDTLRNADIVVFGVSSPGVDWATERLRASGARPSMLALVTKGLVAPPEPALPPLTYADALAETLTNPVGQIVGIGGPCIARELALGIPTHVSFAARDLTLANDLQACWQTDYYRVKTTTDIVGLEACAALKNFLAIGVSAMISAYEIDTGSAKNPVAALYNQAVHELFALSRWITAASSKSSTSGQQGKIDGQHDVAFDLAGMGDLHVTVGGGRNSRLGQHLGLKQTLSTVMAGPMHNVTVEGVDTGRRLAPGFHAACDKGLLNARQLPLTVALLNCIEHDALLEFDFATT